MVLLRKICKGVVASLLPVLLQVQLRVHQVDKPAQSLSHGPEGVLPQVLLPDKELPHEPAEGSRRQVRVLDVVLLQLGQVPDPGVNGLTLPGVFLCDLAVMGLQVPGQEPCPLLFVVLPVVQALAVEKGHIHIRGVSDDPAVRPAPALSRVQEAPPEASFLLRLIEAHKGQGQKGHIILEPQPAELTLLAAHGGADAAVDLGVAGLFLRGKFT